ncbi:MAG: FMN-binding protein [Treponema sp.]|nr:FMN-binding protein [Treponema sp.]
MKFLILCIMALGMYALSIYVSCSSLPGSVPRIRSKAPSYNLMHDGVYEGEAEGWRGTVRVKIRIEDGEIVEIFILDHQDDPYVGGAAMEELLDLALQYGITDLDAVSGATESSDAFLEALEAALEESVTALPKAGE